MAPRGPSAVDAIDLPTTGAMLAREGHDRPIALFRSSWELSYSMRENPTVTFSADPEVP